MGNGKSPDGPGAVTRWFRGWWFYGRAIWMLWRKRRRGIYHSWREMRLVAQCYRFVVSQQHRPEKNPIRRLIG